MSQEIEKIKINKDSESKIIQIIFSVLIFLFLLYGLSFFLDKPKSETITTIPHETNSYLNKTQDVNFSNKTPKNRHIYKRSLSGK